MTWLDTIGADRVVGTLRERVFDPGEEITLGGAGPGLVMFSTNRFSYNVQPATWQLARAPWVEVALRVVADGHMNNYAITYGLVYDRAGHELFLNDPDVMWGLGRRLGDDLDPLAYAEVLSELYSGTKIADSPVLAFGASGLHRAGELVLDVAEFAQRYPFVDPSLVAPPQVRPAGPGVVLDFQSCHYYLSGDTSAVDILQWTVIGGGGREVTWSRDYVAQRVQRVI